MKYLLSGVICIFAVEMLFRLPVFQGVQSSIKASQRAVSVIASSSISDHWKERAVLLYARVIFANSLKLSLCLLAILAPAAAFVILADFQSIDLLSFMLTLQGLVFVTIISIGYVVVRKRFA